MVAFTVSIKVLLGMLVLSVSAISASPFSDLIQQTPSPQGPFSGLGHLHLADVNNQTVGCMDVNGTFSTNFNTCAQVFGEKTALVNSAGQVHDNVYTLSTLNGQFGGNNTSKLFINPLNGAGWYVIDCYYLSTRCAVHRPDANGDMQTLDGAKIDGHGKFIKPYPICQEPSGKCALVEVYTIRWNGA